MWGVGSTRKSDIPRHVGVMIDSRHAYYLSLTASTNRMTLQSKFRPSSDNRIDIISLFPNAREDPSNVVLPLRDHL